MREINEEIDTQWIIIHWKQRNWKTILAVNLALDKWDHRRIYANIKISVNGKELPNYLSSIKDIKKIRFSKIPWAVIIDEWGTNFSSRRSLSKENAAFSELLFLIGKKNCTMIFIAQRFEGLDVNWKELCEFVFKCKKIRRWTNYPLFSITFQKFKKWDLQFQSQYTADLIKIQKIMKIKYDQLEASNLIS